MIIPLLPIEIVLKIRQDTLPSNRNNEQQVGVASESSQGNLGGQH